ncbi:MAG: MBOAT family O-acyltransferase [Myxococcota bacterium]|nr:MBOAT family O-acyltransferase [Myxococcota bacterium]
MLFNTAPFAIFFLLVLAGYRLLSRGRRNAWLLGASLLFYFLWIPAYLLLLLADIGVNYALMRAMQRSARPRRLLVASVVFTLGLLAGFKYAAFLVESVSPLSGALLGEALPVPEVLLPLGISFYSFQILALQVDVYRRESEPPPSLARFALFVAFFPQLVAGPILRGREFLPQLERGGAMEPDRTRRGLWLIGAGVFKKVVMGDFLLAPFVDPVFAEPGAAPAPVQLLAVYGFAFQIYFDFSGYTDMARGMACLLGFELPLNFREPYLSRSPAEFWRRWHMTLSRWLRDYLYVPLGGNRRGFARTRVNLLLTMLLGGLWHGAAWNFVIWGGLHGLWLVLHRRLAGPLRGEDAPLRGRDALRIALCFHAVCLLWVFFRADTPAGAVAILERLFTGSYAGEWPVLPALVIALCAGLHGAERWLRRRLPRLRAALGDGALGGAVEGALLGVIAALAVATSGVGAEFIYFQF